LLIVKKIHRLERTQYAFLDHPKALVFSDVFKLHARALTPFVPIPRAPKKLYRATLQRAQKEDTEDKFLTRHSSWMLRPTRAPFGTFMKGLFRLLSEVVHYQWDAQRL